MAMLKFRKEIKNRTERKQIQRSILILLEGTNGSYEQMHNNRWLKDFDILKEGTNVAKMHVTSFLTSSFNWKKLPDRNIVIELHTVDEIGEKVCLFNFWLFQTLLLKHFYPN